MLDHNANLARALMIVPDSRKWDENGSRFVRATHASPALREIHVGPWGLTAALIGKNVLCDQAPITAMIVVVGGTTSH